MYWEARSPCEHYHAKQQFLVRSTPSHPPTTMRTSLVSSIVIKAAGRSPRSLHLSLRGCHHQSTAAATARAVRTTGSKRRRHGQSSALTFHRPLSSTASSQPGMPHSATALANARSRPPHARHLSAQSDSSREDPHEETQSFLQNTLCYPPAISNGIISALLSNGIPPSSLLPMVKSLAGRYEVGEDGGLVALAASVKKELEEKEGKARVKIWCLPSVGWSAADCDGDDEDPKVGIDRGIDANDCGCSPLPRIHSMERAFAIEAYEGTTLADLINFGADASVSHVDARVRENRGEHDLEVDAAVDDNIDNANVLGEYLECACSGIMACSTCHVVVHPDWFDFDNGDGCGHGMQRHIQGRSRDAINNINNNDDTDSINTNKNTAARGKIGPPSEAEQDMIDLAFQPQLTSRLGCQIVLTKELDGLILLLPKESHNLMDFVPFDG
ncbi:hypothetical protein ACHAXS_009777 [Conticribra weissflogii]